MASFLDIGLLQKFDIIFPFLFVLLIMWGVLSQVKFLGGNKALTSLISLVIALVVLFSASARAIINSIAPWFVIIFVFLILIFISFKTFGTSDVDIQSEFEWVPKILFIVGAVILLYSVINVLVWDKDTETAADVVSGGEVGDSGAAGAFAVLRHPAVMGLILILLIATFTLKRLAEPS
jgi:hypothetical protein